jgi:hypothetical protein
MGLLRELALHWVPMILVLPLAVGIILLGLNVGGTFSTQYHKKVTARTEGANAYAHFCTNPDVVYATGYGNRCRQHLAESQSIPVWEAATATAASYTTLCDPHHGCGGMVMSGLALLAFGLTVALVVACKFASNYQRNLAGFNNGFDETFVYNVPARLAYVDQDAARPRITELKQE